MKSIMLISMFALLGLSFSVNGNLGNSEVRPEGSLKNIDSLIVSHNGVEHIIRLGDTVHIGYGNHPDGSFIYIYTNNGKEKPRLESRFARTTAIVKRIKFWKIIGTYGIMIKGKMGWETVELPQAVEKGEILGFNSTFFGGNKK